MTQVLITVDTELSFGQHRRGMQPEDNFARYIEGTSGDQQVGVSYLRISANVTDRFGRS